MAYTFEIHGEVATEITVATNGKLEIFLETSTGFKRFRVARAGRVGAEVAALAPGDRIAFEVERNGGRLVIQDVRPTYIRGFPHIR